MPRGQNHSSTRGRRAPPAPSKTAAPSSSSSPKSAAKTTTPYATHLQQTCLSVFSTALTPDPTVDAPTLQLVKASLFHRDFAAAFGAADRRRVYASRWSPSRALGYMRMLQSLEEEVGERWWETNSSDGHEEEDGQAVGRSVRFLCLGGGAGAELVATAGWAAGLASRNSSSSNSSEDHAPKTLHVELLDVADWSGEVHSLQRGVTTASLLDPEALNVRFEQADVLTLDDEDMIARTARADLVTLMFTLNELYTASVAQTRRLLGQLTRGMRAGTLLLVVDSPGSYSRVGEGGKYPMHWLLDYTLLGPPKEKEKEAKGDKETPPPHWEKLVSDLSRWFRLPVGLQYPLELENMRYQIHLYRRLPESASREENGKED